MVATHHTNGAGSYHEVTAANPCAACGKPDWCSCRDDGRVYYCWRHVDVPIDPRFELLDQRQDKNGGTFTVWGLRRIMGSVKQSKPKPKRTIKATYDYRNTDGQLLFQVVRFEPKSFAQRKPDPEMKGKWIWKLSETERVLYKLPELTKADPAKTVYVAEGEKDADQLLSLGLIATCNPGGAGKWLPQYTQALTGRHVVILIDNDDKGKQHGELVASRLKGHAASVRVLLLPNLPKKGDVSDWLDAGGKVADLERLAAETPEWQGEPAPEPEAVEQQQAAPEYQPAFNIEQGETQSDPYRITRHVLKDLADNGKSLIFHRGDFLQYSDTDGCYILQQDAEINSIINRVSRTLFENDYQRAMAAYLAKLAKEPDLNEPPPTVKQVTSSIVINAKAAMQATTIIPSSLQLPAWLNGDGPFPANECVACRNLIVHLPTFVGGYGEYAVAKTKDFVTTTCVPFDFVADPEPPTAWLAFLKSLWPDDREQVELLQQWFGYCLLPDTRQQKMLLIVGPKRSGKGTIAYVLEQLLGPQNVAGPTMSSLAANFGLQALIDKPLAVISDARLSGRIDAAVVTERLLMISGEDSFSIDRKYREPWHGQLPTRIMILSNELPRLADASGALASRFLILQCRESFYGREDHALRSKLAAELPGILRWAIDGYERLLDNGRFIEPAASAEMRQDLEDLGSPIAAFVREACEVGPQYEVFARDLFDAWRKWCESTGKDHPGDLHRFGRDLRASVLGLKVTQPRTGEGRMRRYVGIRPKEDNGWQEPPL